MKTLDTSKTRLDFDFTSIHPEARFNMIFQQTLRIPDDAATYALPPSLGNFPLRKVGEFPKVPEAWKKRGGIMMPVHSAEAMWMSFGRQSYPFAVKVSAGKRSAVTGAEWTDGLSKSDYLVCPPQPWLDGFCTEEGKIRQFVAAALGAGLSVEKQLSGEETHGGIQIEVFPMKRSEYEKRWGCTLEKLTELRTRLKEAGAKPKPSQEECESAIRQYRGDVNRAFFKFKHLTKEYRDQARAPRRRTGMGVNSGDLQTRGINLSSEVKTSGQVISADAGAATMDFGMATMDCCMMMDQQVQERSVQPDMAMAAGGQMEQKIHEDPYGLEVWDTENSERVFVHLVNSGAWESLTGESPPATPATAACYKSHGYQWYLDKTPGPALGATPAMQGIQSGQQVAVAKGTPFLPENESFGIQNGELVYTNSVKDGSW